MQIYFPLAVCRADCVHSTGVVIGADSELLIPGSDGEVASDGIIS